jgi:hypothetical protein
MQGFVSTNEIQDYFAVVIGNIVQLIVRRFFRRSRRGFCQKIVERRSVFSDVSGKVVGIGALGT